MLKIAFVMALLLILFPYNALAAARATVPPSSVLFYPGEAQLTVEEKIAPESIPGKGRGLVITLPPNAKTGTFSATVDDKPANGFYWLDEDDKSRARSSDQEPSEERRALLRDMEQLQEAYEKKGADIKVAQSRINLLVEGMGSKEDITPESMLKLDTAFAERLPALYANLSKDQRMLEELNIRMRKAEEVLHAYDSQRTMHTAVIPFAGPEGKAVPVRYSYVMPANYGTSYRLTAYPEAEKLAIEQDATLYQDTGMVWKNTEIYISTTRRDTELRPTDIRPWRIAYENAAPPAPGTSSMRMKEQSVQMANMSEVMLDEDFEETEPVVTNEEKGTFRLWSLGKRTVDPGVAVTLPLSSDEYPAKYYYTLQPAKNAKGYLTAELNLPKALEMPPGRARFYVDNVAVGEQNMSLNGNKATLFFGTDPQVTATMREVKHSEGEQGIFSKEQNVLLHWEIMIKNTRSRPVSVRVMDAIPDAQDATIKIVVDSTPAPEESTPPSQFIPTRIYRWNFDLNPGQTQMINHKVTITAPTGKKLYLNR